MVYLEGFAMRSDSAVAPDLGVDVVAVVAGIVHSVSSPWYTLGFLGQLSRQR